MKNSEILLGVLVATCAIICIIAWYHITFDDIIYIPENRYAASSVLALLGVMFGLGSYQTFENTFHTKDNETTRN